MEGRERGEFIAVMLLTKNGSEGEGRVYCCDVADKEWKGEWHKAGNHFARPPPTLENTPYMCRILPCLMDAVALRPKFQRHLWWEIFKSLIYLNSRLKHCKNKISQR